MKKTLSAMAASLLATVAFAQEEQDAASVDAELPVPVAQKPSTSQATFLPLPFCRMVEGEGLAEVRKPGS